MNILIIKLGAMGDVLRCTFLPRALHEKYKHAKITWVTKKIGLPLLENNPYIERVFAFEEKEKIASEEFDLILSLDDEKAACEFATVLKAKKVVGGILKNGIPSYTKDAEPWFGMGLLRSESEGG